MKNERYIGRSFECDFEPEKECEVEVAIVTDETLDMTFASEDERFHLKAISSDGCTYLGTWSYARAYVSEPTILGEARLALYRAKDKSAVLCGTFRSYDDGSDGRWVVELRPN
ncbi:MAG TPA: hypothetical protein VGN57_07280 [Pirellulaceae bacterium]|jgi:hypothetical protein|nr:hypothetical protein [Pirellulaceae bacterium]